MNSILLSRSVLAAMTIFLCNPFEVHAQQVPPCPKINKPYISTLPASIVQTLQSTPIKSEICKNIDSALNAWAMRRVKGGRDAKPTQPVDVQRAEQELAKAYANPEFSADWKNDQANETTGVLQQILLAARLDEHQYFAARDLILDRISAQ
jgi:hypothetical protein